jgi:hypothetical protein
MNAMSDDPFSDTDRPGAPIDAQFEPAPPAPDAAPSQGAPGWLALGAVGVVSALIGAAAGAYGGKALTGSSDDVARLEARLEEVSAVQASIDEKLSRPAAASAELAGLIGELDAVSQRLDLALAAGGDPAALKNLMDRLAALEARVPATPAPDPQVAYLTERLRNIEAERDAAEAQSKAAEEIGNRADAALALSAIEAATRRGAGFEADYRALRKAAPDSEAVRRLAPFINGVPALTTLQSEFPAVRAAVLEAATPAPSEKLSWADRFFGDAVSIRPASGSHPETTKALDRASAALAAGDLAGAVRALSKLDAAAARGAQDWTQRANRRITLEEALEDVRLNLAEGGN